MAGAQVREVPASVVRGRLRDRRAGIHAALEASWVSGRPLWHPSTGWVATDFKGLLAGLYAGIAAALDQTERRNGQFLPGGSRHGPGFDLVVPAGPGATARLGQLLFPDATSILFIAEQPGQAGGNVTYGGNFASVTLRHLGADGQLESGDHTNRVEVSDDPERGTWAQLHVSFPAGLAVPNADAVELQESGLYVVQYGVPHPEVDGAKASNAEYVDPEGGDPRFTLIWRPDTLPSLPKGLIAS